MLGLILIPMMLGLVIGLTGDDEIETEASEAEALAEDAEYSEEEGQVIQFEDDHTLYGGTDAGVKILANDLDSDIYAAGGNDTVVARGGDDWVEGNTGEDVLYGNDGNDSIFGGEGDDRVFLGDGNDLAGWVIENGVNDTYGDDFIRGGRGDDFIFDSFGSNTLLGDQGNDTLRAYDGEDGEDQSIIDADFGSADTLNGGQGNDLLLGDAGDIFTGGEGSDRFGVGVDLARDQNAVVITDFDVDDDVLTVYGNPEDEADEVISFTFVESQNVVVATLARTEIAVLEGLNAADIPNIDVTFIGY
jgi:Ca2+-binding RTX toxin-like protein